MIADVAQDNDPESGLGAATTGGALITGNTTVSLAWDDDVLTGSGGGQGGAQTDGILQLFWGTEQGGFTDNDADPDFFVFEDLGNDSVQVRAILADDTYGAPITLSGWNTLRSDGVLNGSLTERTHHRRRLPLYRPARCIGGQPRQWHHDQGNLDRR